MQREAFRRAMLIKANIIAIDNPENFQIYDNDSVYVLLINHLEL